MRAIHIDDVHMLARFAVCHGETDCYDILVRAHAADKYLKKFRKSHPKFGIGSISSTLCHMSMTLTGLTWMNEPETLDAFERAFAIIARFKSDLRHVSNQNRHL